MRLDKFKADAGEQGNRRLWQGPLPQIVTIFKKIEQK